MKNIKIKRIVLLSVLSALAICFSFFDRQISMVAFPTLRTAKIGLANIVVLLSIYHFDFKECLILVLLKAIIGNLLFGGVTSIIIGGTASLLSFFAMYFLFLFFKKYLSAVGISVVGGFIHIITQLFVIGLIYLNIGEVLLYYGAILVLISLITSIIIGLIVNRLNVYQFTNAF
ncbi:MAG TPA: Gx transporter family protein [Bacilli bacterium]